MNLKELSRPLDISDVDFRVQSINNGGYATILAYKSARVDMNRLDEVLTPIGWQRDYKLIDGKLFCGVGIYNNETGGWVWKWDVGTESMTEATKGEASDAFKRACFNLGIGRELYDYPIISVKLREDEWTKDGGKPKQTYNLRIKDWKWYSEFTDGVITFLAARDEAGTLRFKWGENKPKVEAKPEPTPQPKVEEKAPEPVQEVAPENDTIREMLVLEYKNLFGKAPHGRMSVETIKKEIDTELDKRAEELEKEVLTEDEEPAINDSGIMTHVDEIRTYNNPADFVAFAKATVSKYIDIEPEETIEAFKAICNEHYAKILKK